MIAASELRGVESFSDLPDDQIEWFLNHTTEVELQAGEAFVRQGDPADWMIIFLEGLFQWTGEFGGDIVSLPAQAGEISGVFPFSRMRQFTVTGRALTQGRLLKFPAVLLPELIQKMPTLTTRLVAKMSDRIREGTRIEQQRDRLISLGRLAAGLAHELNNPASAAQRATRQMSALFMRLRTATSELCGRQLDESLRIRIDEIEAFLMQSSDTVPDGIALGDHEEELDAVLRSHGFVSSWELSAALARCGMPVDTLTSLLTTVDAGIARPVLVRVSAIAELSILLGTIERSMTRISNLVQTVKEYSNLDRASVQNIDVVRSLETTLNTCAHFLGPGVDVRRAYDSLPLLVNTVGTELNQVWANIIENAIEAMLGKGILRLRAFRDDQYVVVEIGDSGPGIPPEIRPHIFDPFFTTKGVGEGTGLGLTTVQTIVRKHGGNVQVSSEPGDTRVQVWLPTTERSNLEKL
jgi:signal transduction histidine kinase